MHDEPHEPGEETGHLHGAEFGDGAVATHGGHGAEILVAEGFEGFAFEGGFEVAREKLALLNGDLCQLRVSARPFGIAFRHDALVADGIDAVEAFDAVVFVDDDAASAAEVVGREVTDAFGGHTTHPNEGAGGDLRAVFELHAVVGVVGDHLVEQDVDAHALEELLDVGGGFFAHGAQQTRTGFDEVDVHQAGGHVGIVLGQDVVFHLRQGAGHFHTRGAAADNDDVEQLLALGFRRAGEGAFEVLEQGVAQAHGFAHVLHRDGVFGHVFVAEEVGGGAGGENQIVVVDFADGGLQDFLFGENAAHLGEAEVEVLSTLEDLAERESDAARFDARGGYLVDERGELMVVVAVDEYDLETGTFEVVGQFETAKTAADNDNARFFAFGDVESHVE